MPRITRIALLLCFVMGVLAYGADLPRAVCGPVDFLAFSRLAVSLRLDARLSASTDPAALFEKKLGLTVEP
jgi:hypothetical protein